MPHKKNSFLVRSKHYFIVGILTIIPIWLTFLAATFVLNFFARTAAPIIQWLAKTIQPLAPALTPFLLHQWFQYFLSITIVILLLCLLGWLTSHWVGKKILSLLDYLIKKVPVAKSIYTSTKRLIEAMQTKPDDQGNRVVLIEFPSPEMKTIGILTKTFTDHYTKRQLAAVYVPTTPNPTSGYLEIVPIEKVIPTPWSMEEAMSFIISGGTSIPETMIYDPPPPAKKKSTD